MFLEYFLQLYDLVSPWLSWISEYFFFLKFNTLHVSLWSLILFICQCAKHVSCSQYYAKSLGSICKWGRCFDLLTKILIIHSTGKTTYLNKVALCESWNYISGLYLEEPLKHTLICMLEVTLFVQINKKDKETLTFPVRKLSHNCLWNTLL